MAKIPTIQVGTGNQTKVVTPALLVALDPNGNLIAISATSDGKIKLG
jgi:hypothetical protein